MGHGWLPFEPPQDLRTQTCPRCYGHGKVLTGSHVAEHIVRDCPECQATGYVETGEIWEPTAMTKAAQSPARRGGDRESDKDD